MQPYSFAPNQGSNCLFKWQVTLVKQITPAGASIGVVFLQQTVATKELLIIFNGIDLGHRRIEK